MKKFITFLIMALISMPLSALDIMNLETGSRAAGSSAELPVRMVQSDENGVTVTYQFSFAELSGDPLYPECTLFRIPGFSLVDEPGKPSVPIRTDIIGIPSNKTAKITIPGHVLHVVIKCGKLHNEQSFLLSVLRLLCTGRQAFACLHGGSETDVRKARAALG